MQAEQFLHIIDQTPLVSIDIILKRQDGKILVGKRTNKPAQHFWFVPGGRIRKNETLQNALTRIATTELGFDIALNDTKLLGAFDHIYEDNFHGKADISTHYVALGHEVHLKDDQKLATDDQHSDVEWLSIEELLQRDDVHQNTKAYFL